MRLLVAMVITLNMWVWAEEAGPRVLDGKNAPASAFPTVGQLFITNEKGQEFLCTGTLVGPRHILTAAHCVTDDKAKPDVSIATIILNGHTHQVSSYYVNPAFQRRQHFIEGNFDSALLELSEQPVGLTPTPLYRQKPPVGAVLTIAGYGARGTGAAGETRYSLPPAGTIEFGTVSTDSVTDTFIKWVYTPGKSDTGHGDSGGPAFISVNGVEQLAGTTIGGTSNNSKFGDTSYDLRVDSVANWINQIIGNTGPSPLPVIHSGPIASKQEVTAGEPVTFLAFATDPASAPLRYIWNFGDGAMGAGGSVTHTYSTAGIYCVMLQVANDHEAVAGSAIAISVDPGFRGHPAGSSVATASPKHQFTLNFVSGSGTIDFTLTNPDFVYANKVEFFQTFFGAEIQIKVGGMVIDRVKMFGDKGIGIYGALQWNNVKGTIRYTSRIAALSLPLLPYGVVDSNVPRAALNIPLAISISDVTYGGMYSHQYTAKEGRLGRGR